MHPIRLSNTQWQPPSKTSLLGRVETITGKENPVEALLKFANDVQLLEQHKTRQRLYWSKKEEKELVEQRKTRQRLYWSRKEEDVVSSHQESVGILLPRVPSVNMFDRFAEPIPARAKKVFSQYASPSSLPATPRTVSTYDSGALSARAGPCRSKARSVCPQKQSSQYSPRAMECQRARAMPPLKMAIRVSSQKSLTERLAEAHVKAGLFIIPTVSLTDEDGNAAPVKAVSVSVNGDTVQEPMYTSSDSPHSENSKMPPSLETLDNSKLDESPGSCFVNRSPRYSTLSSVSSHTTRSSFSTNSLVRASLSLVSSRQKEERLTQQLEEIVEENIVSNNKGREKRQQLQQHHTQQLAQVQELARTMQQFQPQESLSEIQDSLAALRQMMGGASVVAQKLEVKSNQGDDKDDREERAESRASSLGAKPLGEYEDFTDMSLPPLCGVSTHRNAEYYRQARGPACSLALSCSNSRKSLMIDPERRETDSDDEDSSSCSSEGTNTSETYESSSYSKCCRTPTSTKSKSEKGDKHEHLQNLWKRNISLVRAVGRMSTRPAYNEEEYDEGFELGLGSFCWTREDLTNLSTEHKLPFEKVVRARKLFLRSDKNLSGVLGPEEVQEVLRNMFTHLHPHASTIPQSLQSSPSSWGAANFAEVVSFLSRVAFDEASLIPPEQMRTRELAKEWGVDSDAIENVEAIFARVGVDMSGFLDFAKFKQVLRDILALPEGAELQSTRVNLYWAEVNNGTGRVSFEQFFWWHQRSDFEDFAPRSPAASIINRISRFPSFQS